MLTVHRNAGAERDLVRLWGGYSPKPSLDAYPATINACLLHCKAVTDTGGTVSRQ